MSPFFYILLLQKYSLFYIYIAKVQLFIELSSSFMDKFDGWAYFLFIISISGNAYARRMYIFEEIA